MRASSSPPPAAIVAAKAMRTDPRAEPQIDYYYLSKHCVLCGELVLDSAHLCGQCLKNEAAVAIAIIGRASKLEREIQHLAAVSIITIELMVKFTCRFVGFVEVETGPWKGGCSAHHWHALSFMRGGKSRRNYRLFLPSQQRQVYIQDVWLSGSEFTMVSLCTVS
ncbi:hypothetical protein C3L33_09072, partial [Rhododendron williamsianum]